MEPEQPVKTRSQLMIVRDTTAGGVGKQGMQDQLADPCKAQGTEMAIWFAQNGPELVAVAREAVRHAGETVVAGGGDGTINTVASALLGTDKVLGRLPRGTLNHSAKDLPIPLALGSAVPTLMDGEIIPLDGGTVNGHLLLNHSSLGTDPHIVQEREAHQQAGRSKWFARGVTAISAPDRYPRMAIHIRITG